MKHMVSFTFIPNGPERKPITVSEYSLSDIPKKAEEIAVLIQKSINEAKRVLIESSKYKMKWTINYNWLINLKTAFLGTEDPIAEFLLKIHEQLLLMEEKYRRKKCQE